MRRYSKYLLALAVALAAPACSAQEITPATDTGPAPVVTQGLNHIGFAVSDLTASADFFTDALGWRKAGGDPDYPAIFVSDGNMFVTLWQTTAPETTIPFNRKNNVGLHHMAFTIADVETLDELHTRLAAYPGVRIEFAPEPSGGGPTIHMMIREPSGLRLEFAVPGGRSRTSTD